MMTPKRQARWLQKLGIALFIVISASFVTHCGIELVFNPNLNQFVTSTQTPDGTSTSCQPISIPEYTGAASVALSDTSGLSAESAPKEPILTKLDPSGRCGSVEMVVSLEPRSSARGEARFDRYGKAFRLAYGSR